MLQQADGAGEHPDVSAMFSFACAAGNMHGVRPHQHKGAVMRGLPHGSHAALLLRRGGVGSWLAAQRQPPHSPNDVV